jgi:hypothetical protein
MPFVPLDINAPLFTNVEDVSRETLAEIRRDVLKDLAGTTYQRPALVEFATGYNSGGCMGNFYWRSSGRVWSVFGGSLWLTNKAGNIVEVPSSVGLFNLSTPAIFREGSQPSRKLYIANGGRIVEFDGTTAQYIADADAPTQVTHPAILDTYLLANDLTEPEKMKYSDVGTPSNWLGESISAEGEPDRLKAIHVGFREISLFGETSIETWYNDGVSPFSRIEGAMIAQGTNSPYSIKQEDNGYFMLNKEKRVVKIVGRQAQVLSQPIDNILGAIADVTDAQGEIITQNGTSLYGIRVGERFLIYDFSTNEWVSEWSKYTPTKGAYERFRGQHFINVDPWGITLCGDYNGNKLYKLDFDTYQDLGGTLRPSWLTGQISHGTGNEKRSNALRFRLKRGQGTPGGVEPVLLVRWRDDGSKVFSNPVKIPLGFTGDDFIYVEDYEWGVYRSRQWEFACTENVSIAIASVEEDVEVLST